MAITEVCIKNIDVLRETHAAVQIKTKNGDEHWIPFSQVEKIIRKPTAGDSSIYIESWIAKKKGLI